MVQLLVVVRANVAAGKDFFQVAGELSVDGHQIFELTMRGTLLDHPDLPVLFDDGGLDLAHLLVHQHIVGKLSIQNLLPNFRDTLRAKGIGAARPSQWRFGFFIGLEQRFFRPLGGRRGIGANPVQPLKYKPGALSPVSDCFLYIFNRLVHVPLPFP